MATVEVTLTLDAELVAEAREIAESSDLSVYVNDAIGRRLQRERLRRLLDEMDDEYGPIGESILAEVRRAWPAQFEEDNRGVKVC